MYANSNRYEVFLKAAQLGSISKTASALNYTQSGVSRSIAALERETGFPLFVRTTSGIVLTNDGKKMLAPIQKLVNEQANVRQTISEINNVVQGLLRVGAISSVVAQWLPELISRFKKLYPLVEIDILDDKDDEVEEWIINGEVDCGFLAGSVSNSLRLHSLCEDPLVVIVPLGHRLEKRKKLKISDIIDEEFILEEHNINQNIRKNLNETYPKLNVKYIMNSDISALAMVEKGFGISIVPKLVLKSFAFKIKAIPLQIPVSRMIGIASLPTDRMSVLAKTFVEYVLESESQSDCIWHQG